MRDDHYVMIKRDNGVWYYYVYRFGKRVYRSTGETKRSEALCVINSRLLAGDLLNDAEKTRPKTFAEFSDPFWIWGRCPILTDRIARGGHFTKGLAYTNRKNVDKYLLPTFGGKLLPEITPAMVNRWILSLPGKFDITPQTANKQLTMLRQMLDVAVSENLIQDNPARKVRPLVPKPGIRGCFTLEQIRRLLSLPWSDGVVELACRLASLTGMRLGEVRALQRDQIHEDYIEVSRSYSEKDHLKTTKSGKSRVVPIPAWLHDEILALPHNGPFAISYNGDRPICGDTVRDKLKARMEDLGIDYRSLGLHFHSFRHFLNTRLVASGVDGELTRAVIGHESEDMTEHYLHLSADDMARIRIIQESIS